MKRPLGADQPEFERGAAVRAVQLLGILTALGVPMDEPEEWAPIRAALIEESAPLRASLIASPSVAVGGVRARAVRGASATVTVPEAPVVAPPTSATETAKVRPCASSA